MSPPAAPGYREITYRLAGDLQLFADIARRRGEQPLADDADSVRQRIESRRFTLAVVGEFKRGKSTFINALLGAEILPADVLPTSAAINRVTFGFTPSATLYFRDDRPPEIVPIASLAEHVTKLTEGSAARAETIREAVVAYPLQLCRNDVDLIDTPGLCDERGMTDVTIGVLPHIDAAIVVLMADSPFSSSEAALIEHLVRQGVGRVMFVVTAIDRIRREEDRARVIESIRARLCATGLVGDDPLIFPVSGRMALDGRLAGDAGMFERSGFVALEDGLGRELLRTDGVALVRRLHQVDEQFTRMQQALSQLVSASHVPEREPLAALLGAAERGIERSAARWEAMGDELCAAYRPKVEAWPKTVFQVASAAVSRHKAKIVIGWLEHKEEILTELLGDIDTALKAKLRDELASVRTPDIQGVLQDLARSGTALDVLLPFVSLSIGQVPPPPPQDGLRVADALLPTAVLFAQLLPDTSVWREAIDQPALAQLGRGSEKLDFLSKTMAGYNLPSQFAKIVTIGVSVRLEQHWGTNPPLRGLERWWAVCSAQASEGLTSAQRTVRALQGALAAWAERALVQQERDEREIAFERDRIREFEARARQVLADLRAAGF